MSFFERVDRILFELCSQPMTSACERRWILVRKHQFGNLPINAALRLCEARERHSKRATA